MALLCLCGKHDFLWNAFKLDFFKLSRHISHSLYATLIQMKRTYMSLNLRLILYIYTAQTCIHPHHINIFFFISCSTVWFFSQKYTRRASNAQHTFFNGTISLFRKNVFALVYISLSKCNWLIPRISGAFQRHWRNINS